MLKTQRIHHSILSRALMAVFIFNQQSADAPISTGLDNKIFECKIVDIFLPISFNMFWMLKKNRLIETVLLSTHIICFD